MPSSIIAFLALLTGALLSIPAQAVKKNPLRKPAGIRRSSLTKGGAQQKVEVPLYGWCQMKKRCLGTGKAQSGYDGYCKPCFRVQFPKRWAEQMRCRKKSCSFCGSTRELSAAGFCKPCSKARSCAISYAVNEDKQAGTCAQ